MAKKDQTSSDFKAEFIARVKEARVKRFPNAARDMAIALGIEPDTYNKYERRTPLPHELVIKFALICGVSVEYLYTGKEPSRRRA